MQRHQKHALRYRRNTHTHRSLASGASAPSGAHAVVSLQALVSVSVSDASASCVYAVEKRRQASAQYAYNHLRVMQHTPQHVQAHHNQSIATGIAMGANISYKHHIFRHHAASHHL